MTPQTEPDDFLSGESGQVWGIRARTRAAVRDGLCDAVALAELQPWRLRRAARGWPRRRILVLGVARSDAVNIMPSAERELRRSRHAVTIAIGDAGRRGKFENLNGLLERHPAAGHDWLLIVDDDVALPGGFLDAFVFLAERFDLSLAQPAHRWRSHAAWRVTRRRPASLVRETRFVEIGPLCALRANTFETLLPFPPLRFGWGLELHWSALATRHGWREGIVDATPVLHGLRRIAASYDRSDAVQEARGFLAGRPYTTAAVAQRGLAVHRSWR